LLKEYKREIHRYLHNERDTMPRYPNHYFPEEAKRSAAAYLEAAEQAFADGIALPEFPEADIEKRVDNTWGDTGKAIVNNWLGLVYKLTNLDRTKQFMPGIDPDDPLGVRDT